MADLDPLDTELAQGGYAMVVIDPLNAYLGSSLDTNRDAAVRSVLSPLAGLAERHGVAVVALIHPTKGSLYLPQYRIQGSVANSAACRTGLVVGKHEGTEGADSARRHVALLKNNLMADEDKPQPICFELTRKDGFKWIGTSTASADDILGAVTPGDEEEKSAADTAVDVLQQVLADGPVRAEPAKRQTMQAAGVSERTVWTAKRRLGVIAEKAW